MVFRLLINYGINCHRNGIKCITENKEGDKMRFRERLARFMYGRYGTDSLYYFLFVLYFVLWIVQLFLYAFPPVYITIYALQLITLFYMTYRAFSRNIYKRRRENEAFLKVWKPVKGFFILQKNKIRDFKHYRYRKCTHCKATLRLPKRKGAHPVICPRCNRRFTAKVRF